MQSVKPTAKRVKVAVELRSYRGGPPSHRVPFRMKPQSPGPPFSIFTTAGTSVDDPICLDNDDEVLHGRKNLVTLQNASQSPNTILDPQCNVAKARAQLGESLTEPRRTEVTAQLVKDHQKQPADKSHQLHGTRTNDALPWPLQDGKEVEKQLAEANKKLRKSKCTCRMCKILATPTANTMIVIEQNQGIEIAELKGKLADREKAVSRPQNKFNSDENIAKMSASMNAKRIQALERDNEQLADANHELDMKLARIAQDSETQISVLSSENTCIVNGLRDEIDMAKKEIEALKKKDADKEERVATLGKEKDNLLHELQVKNTALVLEIEKSSDRQTRIASLDDETNKLKGQLKTIKQESTNILEDLSSKMKSLQEKTARLNQQHKAQIDALHKEKEGILRDLQIERQEKSKLEAAWKKEEVTLHGEIDKMKKELDEKIWLVKTWRERATEVGKERDELASAAEKAKTKLGQDLEVKTKDLEEKKKLLQESEDRIKSLMKENEKLDRFTKKRISELEEEKAGMSRDLGLMRQELQEKTKLVEHSNGQVAAAEKQTIKLSEDLHAALQGARDKTNLLKLSQDRVDALQTEKAYMSRDLDVKSAEVQQKTQLAEKLEGRISELEEDVIELTKELEERVTAFETEKTIMSEELNARSAELQQKTQRTQELEKQITALETENTKMSKNLRAKPAELQQETPRAKELEDRITILEIERGMMLEDLHVKSAELQQKTRESEEQIGELKKGVTKLTEEVEAELQEKSELASRFDEQVTSLRKEHSQRVQDLTADLEAKNELFRNFNNRIAVLESDKKKQLEDLGAKEQDLQQLNARLKALNDENTQIRLNLERHKELHAAEMQQMRSAVQPSGDQIRQLQEENAHLKSALAEGERLVTTLEGQKEQLVVQSKSDHEEYAKLTQSVVQTFAIIRQKHQEAQAATLQSRPQQYDPELIAKVTDPAYVAKYGSPLPGVRFPPAPPPAGPAIPFHTGVPVAPSGVNPQQAHLHADRRFVNGSNGASYTNPPLQVYRQVDENVDLPSIAAAALQMRPGTTGNLANRTVVPVTPVSPATNNRSYSVTVAGPLQNTGQMHPVASGGPRGTVGRSRPARGRGEQQGNSVGRNGPRPMQPTAR